MNLGRLWKEKGWAGRLLFLSGAVLVFELTAGNYSSVRSLFYERQELTDRIETEGDLEREDEGYASPSGSFSLVIPDLETEINNLHFDWELEKGTVLSYRVSLTDEGNVYPYALPEGQLVEGVESTFHTNLYPYGKVKDLRIDFEADGPVSFRMNGTEANVKRPFYPNVWRMGLLFAAGLLLLGLKVESRLWEIGFDPKSKRQNLATAAAAACFLLLGLGLSHANYACVEAMPEHHLQYQELARAIADGHVWVDDQPSEGLLAAKNPYDTIYLQAEQIPYKADYAYFQGKYYVYFGIVPELIFYLPCYLLTGKNFPNHLAVYGFYAGFVAAVFGLYREAVKRWFAKLPYFAYLLASAVTLTFGGYMYLIVRPDLYNLPIMGANMFTAAGLGLWLAGLNREKRRSGFFLAGSLCMALVAGCRPQMLLFSALAVPLFWEEAVKKRKLFSARSYGDTAAVCLPYVLVAAGIMVYNYLRFASPVDFGAAYSLTNNDMTKRGMNLNRVAYGIFCFFFQPARYEGVFPFLTSGDIRTRYMGRTVSEFTFGGILASQTVTWCLLCLPGRRRDLHKKGLLGPIGCALLLSGFIGAFDANGAGILQRYMSDMVWGIAFAASLTLLLLFAAMGEKKGGGAAAVFVKAALLQHFLYAFLMVFACGDSMNLKNYGPQLFYRAAEMFRW